MASEAKGSARGPCESCIEKKRDERGRDGVDVRAALRSDAGQPAANQRVKIRVGWSANETGKGRARPALRRMMHAPCAAGRLGSMQAFEWTGKRRSQGAAHAAPVSCASFFSSCFTCSKGRECNQGRASRHSF